MQRGKLISRGSITSGVFSAFFVAEVTETSLLAALHINGRGAVFREEPGKARGTYVEEFVRHCSVEATCCELPIFTVLFRSDPDRNPPGDEVIIDLGDCWVSGEASSHRMRPYGVNIRRGARLITGTHNCATCTELFNDVIFKRMTGRPAPQAPHASWDTSTSDGHTVVNDPYDSPH